MSLGNDFNGGGPRSGTSMCVCACVYLSFFCGLGWDQGEGGAKRTAEEGGGLEGGGLRERERGVEEWREGGIRGEGANF